MSHHVLISGPNTDVYDKDWPIEVHQMNLCTTLMLDGNVVVDATIDSPLCLFVDMVHLISFYAIHRIVMLHFHILYLKTRNLKISVNTLVHFTALYIYRSLFTAYDFG